MGGNGKCWCGKEIQNSVLEPPVGSLRTEALAGCLITSLL